MMELSIIKCRDGAVLPIRATKDSAGFDLSACLDTPVALEPRQPAVLIPTGLKIQASRRDVALLLFPRSGLASKHGITLANSVGVVDSDYTGEIMIPLINLGIESFTVTSGMRIAQLVIVPIVPTAFHETVAFHDVTGRGEGGFGHSGL